MFTWPFFCNAALPFSVSKVLKKYEDEFVRAVNAKHNLLKLMCKGVVTQDIATRITATNDYDGKEIFYDHLKYNGSVDTLMEFCKVAIAEDGYPNMQKLAEEVVKELPPQGGWFGC